MVTFLSLESPIILKVSSGICFVQFFLSMVLYLRFRFNFPWYNHRSIFFTVFLGLALCVRGFYYVFHLRFGECYFPDSVQYVLYLLPSYFVFGTYLCMLVLWGEIYAASFDKRYSYPAFNLYVSKAPRLGFALVFTIFITFATLLVLLAYELTVHERFDCGVVPVLDLQYLRKAIWIFIAICYLCTIPLTISFLGYLFYIYRTNYNYSSRYKDMQLYQRNLFIKFTLVGLLSMTSFTIRGIEILLWTSSSLKTHWWTDGFYYLCLENLPLAFMSLLFLVKQHQHHYDWLTDRSVST